MTPAWRPTARAQTLRPGATSPLDTQWENFKLFDLINYVYPNKFELFGLINYV